MVWTVPVALPETLVTEYGLDLAAPYTAGWGFEPLDVGFAGDGRMYVLSRLSRYVRGGEEAADKTAQSFTFWLIARYGADGSPDTAAVFPQRRTHSTYGDAWDLGLSVLRDGTVVLAGKHDATYLIDADLTRVLAQFTMNPHRSSFRDYTMGTPFATHVRVTPGGRLVCVLAEFGTYGYGSYVANLVGVADTALSADARSTIRVVASLDSAPRHQKAELDVRPYALHQGLPVGLSHRPDPGLAALVKDRWPGRFPTRGRRLGRPEPLSDDLFVVPLFSELFRSGNRGNDFWFLLLDADGKIAGRLEGLDPWSDSPYTGECRRVVADPPRSRVFHLNRYGLYAWSADGTLLARVPVADKPFSVLKNFGLLGCAPNGDLVLAQQKQHLVVRVPVPETDLDTGLAGAVEGALAAFAKRRTALKKDWAQVAWHWTHAPETVNWL